MNSVSPVIKLTISTPKVKLSINQRTKVSLNVRSSSRVTLRAVKVNDVTMIPDNYTGEYVIESSTEEQTLLTSNKFLKDDVVVKSIPYDEVSNPSGGTTFYIGKDVEV